MNIDKMTNYRKSSPEQKNIPDSSDPHQIYPKVDINNIKAELSVRINRISFDKIHDEIIYLYKLKNVGTLAIWSNITIINSTFTKQFIDRIYIAAGNHINFTQKYKIKTNDLYKNYIVNSCIAYIQVDKNIYVKSNQIDTCVANGLNI